MYIRTTKVVTEDHRFDMPEWIELALAGNRIGAIKALREVTSRLVTTDTLGNVTEKRSVGLLEAKMIVENLLSSVDPVEYSKREKDFSYDFVTFDDLNR